MSEEDLAHLRELKDEDIDYSDIPPQEGRVWRRVIGPGFAGGGETLLVLDADVCQMYRERGELGREQMNAVLRDYAQAHRKIA